MIKATLNLINRAIDSGEKFDRFCLLSGSDFPIKPLSKIKSAFDTDKEFIRIGRRLGDSDITTHWKAVRAVYFFDYSLIRDTRLSGAIPRKAYRKLTLYQGAQWWYDGRAWWLKLCTSGLLFGDAWSLGLLQCVPPEHMPLVTRDLADRWVVQLVVEGREVRVVHEQCGQAVGLALREAYGE